MCMFLHRDGYEAADEERCCLAAAAAARRAPAAPPRPNLARAMAAPKTASANHVPAYMRCVCGMTNVSASRARCLVSGYAPGRGGSGSSASTATTAPTAPAFVADADAPAAAAGAAVRRLQCAAMPRRSTHENSLSRSRCAMVKAPSCSSIGAGGGGLAAP